MLDAANTAVAEADGPQIPGAHDNTSPSRSRSTTTTSAAAVPTPCQRDPPIFSGVSTQDIDDWLSSYDRVSAYNRWDVATKLCNAAFYLDGLTKTWFQSHEQEFLTWTIFRNRVRDLFGRPTKRKANALRKLSLRCQLPGESYVAYIEDVLALSSRPGPTMSEGEKVASISKDISEELFQFLLLKEPTTVTSVMDACRTLQEKRNTRLLAASSQRVISVS